MDPVVFEQTISSAMVEVEDSGMAKSTRLGGEADGELAVSIHSWNEEENEGGGEPEHPQFDALIGKRVRVTIEVID